MNVISSKRHTPNTKTLKYRYLVKPLLILTISLIPTVLPAALTVGLEAYYNFDASSGWDSSGNGLHLTTYGEVGFESGLIGSALAPNGNPGQYAARTVDDDSLDFGTGDFTVQAWVNYNNLSGEQVLLEKFTGTSGPGWSVTKLSDQRLAFVTDNGSAPTLTQSMPTITIETWHNVTVRKSSGVFNLFLDNQLIASLASEAGSSSSGPLFIGRRNLSDPRVFSTNGRLDEVGIWSRALDDAELTALYNGGSGMQIPETSSALLVILGAGCTLLRRRRA